MDFPTDGNPQNGLESELTVLVPGGISSGNVELTVNGIVAGASGYEACPQIMGFTLGRNGTQEFLNYQPLLGFLNLGSFVQLYGINFNEIAEVQLEDTLGTTARILPNSIERNPAPPGGGGPSGSVPTGYTSIGFNLRDARNDIRLNFSPDNRDNMKIRIRGPAGLSNTIEVPVHADMAPFTLGAVINGTKVPTGVRTGPIRVRYSMYDRLVETNYRMELYWRLASDGDDPSLWRPAAPDITDPEHSGRTGILPGMIGHTSRHRLFAGGGALRTFTWDAQNDPLFRQLNAARPNNQPAPRDWAIKFLLRPQLDTGNATKPQPNHQVETPTILYYSLDDRPGEDASGLREAIFSERFETDLNENSTLTTAEYGPPNNPGSLTGKLPPTIPAQFGQGTASLIFRNTPVEELNDGAVLQYYEIDTDLMTIVYKQVSNDLGTPCDPTDDELAGGGRGLRPELFDNPGAPAKEFHLASLTVEEGVLVYVRGPNPFILRLNGTGGAVEDPVFICQAGVRFDLNGCPGEPGPRPGGPFNLPGRGGLPGPGGGEGGDGGSFESAGQIIRVLYAEAGGNDGGGAGETTGGWDSTPPLATAGVSRFPGGPGGGGGNRIEGNPGDAAAPAPTRFNPSGAGDGGRARGEPSLLLLSPGSGGGGGGGTIGTTADAIGVLGFNGGAGGGGGGGAFHVAANGTIILDPSANVETNGGDGGAGTSPTPAMNGAAPVAPGGAGSGGCVLLQARGAIEADCESFRVRGGAGGAGNTLTRQNALAGAGAGGDGWIRLESALGGVPTCVPFAASTVLTAAATTRATALMVASTAGFPDTGTLAVLDPSTSAVLEEMAYRGKAGAGLSFDPVFRAPGAVALPVGSVVVLKGAIFPYNDGILSEGKVVPSPDAITPGRGRDQEVHIRFEPSTDPTTGGPLFDPETGDVISVWDFDTDLSVIRRPSGEILLETNAADTDPGFLDCTRLVIDPRTILRGIGTRPMKISVSGQADIGGTIDVSGFPGGLLQFSGSGTDPLPGLGGAGGPGGGAGGAGGRTEYVNGNRTDKTSDNTLPIHGSAGKAPAGTPAALDRTPASFGDGDPDDALGDGPHFVRATGGSTLREQDAGCGEPGAPLCVYSAGGGGGGGNLEEGSDGKAEPAGIPSQDRVIGQGGSIFGIDSFRFGGEYWLRGGTGGGGGGGNPHVHGDYQIGILGTYRFRRSALDAPGTGGGGGGGVLHIIAQNLALRSSGRILARGGDAFQGIDLSGNGGSGAGGTVILQVLNAISIEAGGMIDVSAGRANLAVPAYPGDTIPAYPGNVRDTIPGGDLENLGGAGGTGSPGRIRIEADSRSLATSIGANSDLTAGPFLIDTSLSLGVTRAVRLGLGPGLVATTHHFILGTPVTRFFEFGQPSGTDSIVLWQGAMESLDQHGTAAPFSQLASFKSLVGLRDPSLLRENEFIRFVVPILTNTVTQSSQSFRSIELPYGMVEALP
ncbi:MAG TPA: hypothetical protein VMT52_04410 [Planctomycetota bacterium]|nr:hypothetical protein [Planctomycetota bacterium]